MVRSWICPFPENDQRHEENETEGHHHAQHSEIDQNKLLLVRFQNLGSDDVIVPGMANLSFNIKLSSMADPREFW